MPDDYPDRQVLPGQTIVIDEQIIRVRLGFLPPFFQDPRVVALFTQIEREAGLLAAARRFARLAKDLAARIGRHRSELWPIVTPPEDLAPAIDAVAMTPDFQRLFEQTMEARAAAIASWEALDAPVLAARLEVFVEEIGLRWRWLAIELARHYCETLFCGLLLGRQIIQERVLAVAPRDPLTANSETLMAALQEYVTTTRTHRRTKRAGQKSEADHLERWTACFYRHHVKDPADSWKRLAHDLRTSTANIKHGIERVRPLLDHDRLSRG